MFNLFGKKEGKANLPEVEVNLSEEEKLQKELKRRAYMQAELDLGTNMSNEQANVSLLREEDSGYIKEVEALVTQKLNDPEWIKKTIAEITKEKSSDFKGHDELYQPGHGILEQYKEKEKGDNEK